MPVTEAQVLDALRPVQDPELHRSIVDLDMVRRVAVDGPRVDVTVALTVAGCPLRSEITRRVDSAVSALDGVEAVDLDFTVMTDDERVALRTRLHGDPAATAGTHQAHGHAEGREIPFADPGSKTRVLLVASGKGGVGKSSVTANLSVALADRGHDVAVVDADVWGFSIPRMLGVQHAPVVIDQMLVPPEANGVRCISMGFFAQEDQPVIWRGPMLHKALEQFLTDVFWDDPDYLVVDLPPGTGDISISLAQFLPRAEVLVVTTPQPAAQRVAQRAAFMAQKVNLEVKGVIENMSWFTGDDGKRYELFGAGGGEELAARLGVPLIAQVPLVPELRAGADAGTPIVASDPDGEAARVFARIAETIDVELAPRRVYRSELRIS
ncbi:MAG: Mrp/NBP35 family ATP-binding protein [Acidimicrobiales bacterium]